MASVAQLDEWQPRRKLPQMGGAEMTFALNFLAAFGFAALFLAVWVITGGAW